MRTTYILPALILTAALSSAAESERELENLAGFKQSQLSAAQVRLRSAEASLRANTAAVSKAVSPQEKKTIASYVANSQAQVAKERSEVVSLQREIETINARLTAIRTPDPKPVQARPEESTQAAATGKASAPAPQKLHAVLMKDGRKIECVRFMEVDHEYVLQLPDKKLQNVKKADVASIESP